ncbi:hypothetical protein ACWF9G_08330 [Nocardia sp. NPDC055029]
MTEVWDTELDPGSPVPDPFDEHAVNANTNATRASSTRTSARDRPLLRFFSNSSPAVVETRAR